MDLSHLSPAPGAKKNRKRIGRGNGSGHGKTAGRGHKGQGSRAGGGPALGFEGGQMPLTRRVPKRGFHNPFRIEYVAVNLDSLNRFDAGQEVTPESLRAAGMVRRGRIKVLAKGELGKALTVKAHGFSHRAKEKIEAAGGRTEIISHA